MTALIDLDSVLYKAVYKIVSISDMREAIRKYGKQSAKQWLKEEVYNEGINRCENELLKMQYFLQNIFFEEINAYEIFITTCTNSFRKQLSKTYKSNRKKNKYVWMLREHYRHNDARCSDRLEADDLIAIKAKELGDGNFIIVSPDKDLKQIGGYFWSYYSQKVKDEFGFYVQNEFGFYETEYKQKEVLYISSKEADLYFWSQMLIGDSSDNIKGVKGIGVKKADKILESTKSPKIAVARAYIKSNQKEDYKINYQLLKLG